MKRNGSLLESLLELQHLDRVPRMGFVLRGVSEPESVSEHLWHVAVLVWALGGRVDGLDLGRAVVMALVHDAGEVRLGDLPMTTSKYFQPGAKAAAEATAFAELMHPFGDAPAELLADLQARESAEARLVKDCDKLQLMLKVAHYERHGARGLEEFWQHPGNFPSQEFEPVATLFAELKAWRESW